MVPASLGQIQASLSGSVPVARFVLDDATELEALINVQWGGNQSRTGTPSSVPEAAEVGLGPSLGPGLIPAPLEMISAEQEGGSRVIRGGAGGGRGNHNQRHSQHPNTE